MQKYVLTFLFTITLGVVGVTLFSSQAEAQSFNAGRIMEDSVFTHYNSMNTNQIQSFLNSKVPQCDTNGNKPSEYGGGTRRQYAASRGVNPPFTCLKDYRQNNKSAAQIIRDAAHEFRINPQVIIVLIQKEQGLVTDEWPWPVQYRSATGYGCPDTAPCDSQYYGLTNQVRWAARMFRAIMDNSPSWYTPYVLGNNQIPWNPDIGRCGYSTVNIQNRATQALYNYTPYRPNQAALNAGYGTGDSCSSYGNRNFFLYFRDWFGFNRPSFTALEIPRWMETDRALRKVNPYTGAEYTNSYDALPEGQQIRFVDKVLVNNVWYLRSEYDKRNNQIKGIPLTSLREVPYQSMTPRQLALTTDLYKQNPRAQAQDRSWLLKGSTFLNFTSRIVVNGQEYYRTEHDTTNNINRAIPVSRLKEPTFEAFETQRFMQIKNTTRKVNPISGAQSSQVSQGTHLKFTSKMRINGRWFYRTEHDTQNNNMLAIPAGDIAEIPYVSIGARPYWLRLKNSTTKVQPTSGITADSFGAGRQILVAQKITVNGTEFYRSKYDMDKRQDYAMPASDFEEIPFEPLETPREMRLRTNTRKVAPKTGQSVDETLQAGRVIRFTTKIRVDGVWYLRSEYDTNLNLEKGIPLHLLSEL